MFLKSISNRTWLIGLLIFVSLSAAFLLILGWQVKKTITDQVLQEQQIVSRAEASNITSFLQSFGNSEVLFAQRNGMRTRDSSTQEDLDEFLHQWSESGLVPAVVLTDARGVVIFNSDISGDVDIGADLSDRDFFAWAKNPESNGKYFVGRAVVGRLTVVQGKVIAPVATPVYENGIFRGVISAAVHLAPLTSRYLGLMKVSDVTNTYLIGYNGDLLYSSNTADELGENVFSDSNHPILGGQSLTDKLKAAVNKNDEASFTISLSDAKTGKPNSYLVTYAPVLLADRNWLLVMVSPNQKVIDLIMPIYVQQAAMFILLVLGLISFGIIIAKESQKLESIQSQEKPGVKPQNKL